MQQSGEGRVGPSLARAKTMGKPPSHETLTPEDFRRIREVFESALNFHQPSACHSSSRRVEETPCSSPKWDGCSRPMRQTTLCWMTGADHRFRAGAIFAGHYKFAGLIGRGGMGEVYRGRDTNLNRDVALSGTRQPSPSMATG